MYHRQALRNRAICDSADALAGALEQRLGAELERRAGGANVIDQDRLRRRRVGKANAQTAPAQALAAAKAALPTRDCRSSPQRAFERQQHKARKLGCEQIGVVKAALAEAEWAGRNGNQRGVWREGARRQRIDDLSRHQRCQRCRGLKLECVNQGPRRPFELQRRPMLRKHAAAAARRQRLNPRKLRATVLAEPLVGRFTTGPAERRDDQV